MVDIAKYKNRAQDTLPTNEGEHTNSGNSLEMKELREVIQEYHQHLNEHVESSIQLEKDLQSALEKLDKEERKYVEKKNTEKSLKAKEERTSLDIQEHEKTLEVSKMRLRNIRTKQVEAMNTFKIKLLKVFRIPVAELVKIQRTVSNLEGKISDENEQLKELYIQREKLSEEIGIIRNDQRALAEKIKDLRREVQLFSEEREQSDLKILTPDEKMNILSVEEIAKLPFEEYMLLWARLNPHYLSHVTRHGFRETVSIYHQAGKGEFQNAFEDTLEGGKALTSNFSLDGLKQLDKKHITIFLKNTGILDASSLAEAQEMLGRVIGESSMMGPTMKVGDRTAVHFAANMVTESYGAEHGNQIFYIYPSDIVASSFRFGSTALAFKNQRYKGQNDVYVWSPDHKAVSIPIDLGITFIPKSVVVDPVTGSKYSSQSNYVENSRNALAGDREGAITSEQYWEAYFAQHPNLRPRHLYYYDGSPEEAVNELKRKYNVGRYDDSKVTGENLGFDDHVISFVEDNTFLLEQKKELVRISEEIIEEYYSAK